MRDGQYEYDTLARLEENYPGGKPLLQPLMRNGRRVNTRRPAAAIRESVLAGMGKLPAEYHALSGTPEYPVKKSDALLTLLDEVRRQYVQRPANSPTAR